MPGQQPAMSPSDVTVAAVLDRVTGPRRGEAEELVALHTDVSGHPPVVWAGRILGFGEYEYRYPSGHAGRAPLLAFAPGPRHHTVYLAKGFAQRWPDAIDALGPHRASAVCLYLTRLTGVNRAALRTLLERTLEDTLNAPSTL